MTRSFGRSARRLLGIAVLLLALALPASSALAQQYPYGWYGRGYTGTGHFGNYNSYGYYGGSAYPYGYGSPAYPNVPYGYFDPNFGPYVYSSYGYPYFGLSATPYGYYDPYFGPSVYGYGWASMNEGFGSR